MIGRKRLAALAVSLSAVVASSAAVVMLTVGSAYATTTTLCNNQTTPVGGGAYTVQNNEWNSTASECITTDGNTDFTVANSSISNGTSGGPGGYPSIYQGCHWGNCTQGGLASSPVQVSSLTKPGTVTTSWSTTQPGGGNTYDVAYDIWYNQTPTTKTQPNGAELMIWLNHNGSVQPFGSQVATTTVNGVTYQVWFGVQSWNTISYVMANPTTSVTNLDVGALTADAVSRGYIQNPWYLIDVEAGFELWQGGAGLTTNSFSVSLNSGGGTTSPSPSASPSQSASPSPSPSKSASPSASPSASSGSGSLTGEYLDYGTTASTNQVKPGLQVVNNSSSSIALSQVTIRYWFEQNGGSSTFTTNCYYALVACGNVTEQVVAMSTPVAGADHYLQIGFTSGAGNLAPGAASGDLQAAYNKTDWSNFNQANDYSYNTNTTYQAWSHITVYINGTLVWGTQP